MRLSKADRDVERSEAFDVLARLLRNLVTQSPTGLEQTIADVFPWATFLPRRDRAAFVDELTTTLMAAGGLDNFAPVGQMLREWKATAEIHADWEQICSAASANARVAWERITAEPRRVDTRQHRLKSSLGTRAVNGIDLEQWQYDVTAGGRIWCCIDDDRRTVWMTDASVGHPNATE